MMITKISKLKEFGIYHDFSWETEHPEFKKFNLIYGWNRSGKTTVSRVFASCEKKCVYDKDEFKQYPENGEFEIKTSDDITIKNTDVASNNLPIKVFNQDFIDDNISFDVSNSCNPIVYVSEEDIKTKKKLKLLRENTKPLSQNYQTVSDKKSSAIKVVDNFRISVAQTITQLLTDKKNRDIYYSYNKSKVKDKIDEIGIDNFNDRKLSNEDKKKNEEIIKSVEWKNQPLFRKFQSNFLFNGESINYFENIFTAIQTLLSKKVVSETLERLKDDQKLNNWVKQGFDLHKTKEEKENCLFCQKPFDSDFLSTLSKHFSKDYEDLQSAVIEIEENISRLKEEKIAFKNEELYFDLKEEYETRAKALNEIIEKLNAWLDSAISKLNEKHNNPLIIIAPPEKPEDFLSAYNAIIDKLNKIFASHNLKVKNHAIEVKNAKEKLELHSIAVALSEQNYGKLEKEIKDAETAEKEAKEAVNKNDADIFELEKKTSDIAEATNKINEHLKAFFGREEIKLELDGDNKGYIIKRDGRPANNLSESEKTAIAFSYFIVKVEEKEFTIKDGIIFIDDPISSFDSNFIYNSFSLINTHFKEAGQLFISTHNFQLFNLLKEWFINKNNNIKHKNEKRKTNNQSEKSLPCEFYMIENFTESDIRKAKIIELDKTLKKYKSEYHFLFSLLNKFKEEDFNYVDFYTIGNVARRFFDIFIDFKIPDSRNQKQKMEAIVKELNNDKKENEKISDSDWNKAYKLVNEFSHNSDPTSMIEHKDKSESKDAIKILLNIVKESDPTHYEILEKNI